MITLIVTHPVHDFETWKAAFESEPAVAMRAKYGMHIVGLYHGLQNPNEVTLIARTTSPESLQTMFNDPEQQAIMQKAGVAGAPTIQVVKQVETSAALAAR